MTASDCQKLVVAEDEHLIGLYVARAVGEAHEFYPISRKTSDGPRTLKRPVPHGTGP